MIYLNTMKVEDLPRDGIMPAPSDQTISDFYVRLGMAIAAWQFVEARLIELYVNAVKSKSHREIQASFHVPSSFRTRLDMVSSAIRHSDLKSSGIAEWDKLAEKIRKKSSRRNDIAHSIVFHDFKRNPNDSLYLSANPMDPNRSTGKHEQADIITKNELEVMIGVFGRLSDDITSYNMKWLWPHAQGLPVPSSARPDVLTSVPVDHFRAAPRWRPES